MQHQCGARTQVTSFKKIQTAHNPALRMATGTHKMASIDHLHQESLMLRVKDHSDMFSVQYLVNCLEEDYVSHGISFQEPRPMKETLHPRHHSTVPNSSDATQVKMSRLANTTIMIMRSEILVKNDT